MKRPISAGPANIVVQVSILRRTGRGSLDPDQGRRAGYGVCWKVPGRPEERHTSAGADIQTFITDQCALFARAGEDFRVDVLVAEGDTVAQGAPVLRSRRNPELVLTAPVAGEVAAIDLGPGRRLAHVLFFHAPAAGRHVHDAASARKGDDPAATRALLLSAGLWPLLRSRPFGRIPALEGREEDFSRGLHALAGLTDGPVILCQDCGPDLAPPGGRCRIHKAAPVHPHGLAGFRLAGLHPAGPGRIVWDIHAEDVAAIGALLATGLAAETRLVSVSGPALRERRLVRCQPGADLRALTFDIVRPGPHRLLSGSALDGVEGRWLGRWHRQATAVADASDAARRHWFPAALRRAGRPLPVIPTAALDHAFGGLLPAAPLVRALSANDAETAARLGALSLVEEDLALADYVTGATPRLSAMLRAMLDRIEAEAPA